MKLNNKNKNKNSKMNNSSKKKSDGIRKENCFRYKIKSKKCPPQVEDLILFEEDMINFVHQIRFCQGKSNLQRKLNKDLRIVKS